MYVVWKFSVSACGIPGTCGGVSRRAKETTHTSTHTHTRTNAPTQKALLPSLILERSQRQRGLPVAFQVKNCSPHPSLSRHSGPGRCDVTASGWERSHLRPDLPQHSCSGVAFSTNCRLAAPRGERGHRPRLTSSVCSPRVSVSHLGHSHTTSDIFITVIVFVMAICGRSPLMPLRQDPSPVRRCRLAEGSEDG